MGYGKEILDPLHGPTRALRRASAGPWAAFAQLHREAFVDGSLPEVTKELIAVAISVAQQCDGCIASHTRSAVAAGATREQFAEMLSVVLFMMGGPGSIYAPRAFEAYEEFAGAAEQATAR